MEEGTMFLEISEERKNKEITFMEAEKIKKYILDLIDRVPPAFFPRTYECYSETLEFTGYLRDIEQLKNLYVTIEKYLSKKAAEIEISDGLSLQEYNLIYKVSDINDRELDAYRMLQEKFNIGVTGVEKSKHYVLETKWEEVKEVNQKVLEQAKGFADNYSERKTNLEEQYEMALFQSIEFWGFLNDMPKGTWRKVAADEEDKIIFFTGNGKMIGAI